MRVQNKPGPQAEWRSVIDWIGRQPMIISDIKKVVWWISYITSSLYKRKSLFRKGALCCFHRERKSVIIEHLRREDSGAVGINTASFLGKSFTYWSRVNTLSIPILSYNIFDIDVLIAKFCLVRLRCSFQEACPPTPHDSVINIRTNYSYSSLWSYDGISGVTLSYPCERASHLYAHQPQLLFTLTSGLWSQLTVSTVPFSRRSSIWAWKLSSWWNRGAVCLLISPTMGSPTESEAE
jgi:hypothetical protein